MRKSAGRPDRENMRMRGSGAEPKYVDMNFSNKEDERTKIEGGRETAAWVHSIEKLSSFSRVLLGL